MRTRSFWSLQEAFLEAKLADTSADYDFVSVQVGQSQPFISDFRGFLFADINDALRLFGTRNANRDQYNVACTSASGSRTLTASSTPSRIGARTWSSPTTIARTS